MSTARGTPRLRSRPPSDAELVAGIRAAAREVLDYAEVWRRSEHWQRAAAGEQQAYEAVQAAWAALGALGEDAAVDAAVEAVAPILRAWWPLAPTPAAAAAAAVEHLRMMAIHRPGLVRRARQLVGPEQLQAMARHAAYGLWLDLDLGLLPALEVGEIRGGEVSEELDVALAAIRTGAPAGASSAGKSRSRSRPPRRGSAPATTPGRSGCFAPRPAGCTRSRSPHSPTGLVTAASTWRTDRW